MNSVKTSSFLVGLGMTQEDICPPELLDANDRRSELRDGGIAPP
ncbi:MAG TPA: hypothetical protein VGL12_16585 [Roseiarcus sp.]